MLPLNKYLIKPADKFKPEYFLSINEEITGINKQTEHLSILFKAEIIVSFLKDHSLRIDWIKANPELTTIVTSGSLFTGDIELLFESCRNNPEYRHDVETYLLKRFSEIS